MVFLRKIQETIDQVRSNAFHRSKALEKLSDLQLQIAEHLFKIAHYPNHSAYSHWLKELRAWNGQLRRLHRSKTKRGNYSQKVLLKALWTEPLGEKDDRIELAAQIVNDGLPPVQIEEKKLKNVVEKFVQDILDPTPGHTFSPL